MVALQPEQRRGEEEVRHLAPPEIVDQRVPVAVKALPRVLMLVERRAVEPAEPMRVGGKCAGTQSMMTPMPAR